MCRVILPGDQISFKSLAVKASSMTINRERVECVEDRGLSDLAGSMMPSLSESINLY